MSAPQSFVVGPPSAQLVERPCPLCGASSPILVLDPPLRRSHVCRCGALVGTPGCFVDDRGARRPLRAVFSSTSPPPCANCHRPQQRVLIDERPGVWCPGCGLVALPERRHDPSRGRIVHARWPARLLGALGPVGQDARAAAVVAVLLGLMVAALHIHAPDGDVGEDGPTTRPAVARAGGQPSSSSSVR
jgi:hypothetical protein